jgi:hypothetical protein
MEMLDRAKAWILKITELGLLLVALAIVLQMLFGTAVPFLGKVIMLSGAFSPFPRIDFRC